MQTRIITRRKLWLGVIGVVLVILLVPTLALGLYRHGRQASVAAANITFSDKGKTVRMSQGGTLIVTLDNTYWQFGAPSNASVVAQIGNVEHRPSNQGVPGTGAGTVVARFKAVSAGTAKISAHRNSCGEAMGCSEDNGNFSVTVVVE